MPPIPAAPTTELGAPARAAGTFGVFGSGVVIDDRETQRDLRWPKSTDTYQSMLNDAHIDGMYRAIALVIRGYHWHFEPNGARPAVLARVSANYNLPIGPNGRVDQRRSQRRFLFDEHLETALRGIVTGHRFFEQLFDVRQDGDPARNGGWVAHLRKLADRPPRTISEIKAARDGGLSHIKVPPMVATDSVLRAITGDVKIPVDRLVAYVWDREGANWRGRSMLRSLYRPWKLKDRVLRVGAINIERAGGVPYVEAPEGATPRDMEELHLIATSFRVGDSAGAALPHGAQLKFASAAGGSEAINYVRLQNEEMARAWLLMFMMLGQTQTGSRALGESMVEYVGLAEQAIAKWFAGIFSRHVIEDDVELNEGPGEEYAPLLAFRPQGDPLAGVEEAVENAEREGALPGDSQVVAAVRGARGAGHVTHRQAADFDPAQPRDDDGRWTRTGFHVPDVSERLALGIPPAWTGVQVADDPAADLQVLGRDSKGREQRRYSREHTDRQAAAKFDRVRELQEQYSQVDADLLDRARAGDDPSRALLLIARMGLRPGSETDTGADRQAFGASTLKVEHVTVDGDRVRLAFPGKSGKDLDLEITDPDLAELLTAQTAGRPGAEQVFRSSAQALRDRLNDVAAGFKVKDLRTRLGSQLAREKVAEMDAPTTQRTFDRQRRDVGEHVADRLGNTRTVALESYVDPTMFGGWKQALEQVESGDASASSSHARAGRRGAPRALRDAHDLPAAGPGRAAAGGRRSSGRGLGRNPVAAADGRDPAGVERHVDWDLIDETWTAERAALVAAWLGVREAQITDLAGQIEQAEGDVSVLAQIAVSPAGAALIAAAARRLASFAAGRARDEAGRQGHELPDPDLSAPSGTLADRADALSVLLARAISETAARHAIERTGATSIPAEVAEDVADHLRGLSNAYLEQQLGGALTHAMGAGRVAAYGNAPAGTRYAGSALLDASVCGPCSADDGREFATLTDAMVVYPLGAQNRDCEGGIRCRCTVIATYPESAPTVQ